MSSPSSRTYGIVYIAYGELARREATMSIATLRSSSAYRLQLATIGDTPIPNTKQVKFDDPRWGARWAKLNLDRLSPFDDTIYIDADTRIRGDLLNFYAWLDDGYDLVIGASGSQGTQALWHVADSERDQTFDTLGFTPIQLQAGLFAFRKSPAISALFAAWRAEYEATEDARNDQAALLRALYAHPVRYLLLSKSYCDTLIAHLFGKLRKHD